MKRISVGKVFSTSKRTESESFNSLQRPISNENTERAFAPFLKTKKRVPKKTKRESVRIFREPTVRTRRLAKVASFFTCLV